MTTPEQPPAPLGAAPTKAAAPPPSAGESPRRSWHLRANAVVLGYLGLSILAVPLHDALPVPRWLVVHLLLLGAATNAIVTWGEHFAVALLRARQPSRRLVAARLAALNVGVLGVLVGVAGALPALTVVAAGVLTAVVASHIASLLLTARRALNGRFAGTIRFYVAAGLALVVGVGFGTLLASHAASPDQQAPLLAAHVHANVFGWIGLTVLGTLFTLWPTVLRTRMTEGVMRAAAWCLSFTGVGLTLAVTGLALNLRAVAVVGLVGYATGVGAALRPFVATWRRKAPHDVASWSLAAATCWLGVGVLADIALLAGAHDIDSYLPHLDALVPLLLAGFVGQILLGALSYLIPVVLGGGPTRLRAHMSRLGLAWPARVVMLNVGVPLLALPVPGWARTLGWVAVLAPVAAFLLLTVSIVVPAPSRPRAGMAGVALGLAMTLGSVGLALSGSAPSSEPTTVSLGGTASGAVREVAVTLVDLDILPGTIEVPAGTRLHLVVTNKGGMRHDLSFPGGPATRLLAHGEQQSLDLGPVTVEQSGWCTVPGHRAAGMTLDIKVSGDGAVATPPVDHASMPGMPDVPSAQAPGLTDVDVHGQPGPGWTPYDARLAPAGTNTVHQITLHIIERDAEVAPGAHQRIWTFGGTAPGPVLHGHVGDTFEVTLVNDGTMGHSIDFHAGALAPDAAMRTIEPGQSLLYRFRADYAGAWLYHCATMPMLDHIANGMYGAVIIDPPDLAAVGAEYVLVGSELYLGPAGGVADDAKLRADAWDAATFNGYPDQYVHAPLTARDGERVRFWVLAAGPTDGMAFHVVGTQFDTVFKEGAYLLRAGNPAHGAAQVLDLSPAQGGFVETVFGQAGHYSVIDHDMRRGEGGAHGIVDVGP